VFTLSFCAPSPCRNAVILCGVSTSLTDLSMRWLQTQQSKAAVVPAGSSTVSNTSYLRGQLQHNVAQRFQPAVL
jgi:hypothetical protein